MSIEIGTELETAEYTSGLNEIEFSLFFMGNQEQISKETCR